MNLQTRFIPKQGVVLDVIGRLLTRNQVNAVTRTADRLQFMKNFQTLADHPDHHLSYALKLIDDYAQVKQEPTFEMGLILGCAVVFCAGHVRSIGTLRQVLGEIERQQENLDSPRPIQPETEGETNESARPDPSQAPS